MIAILATIRDRNERDVARIEAVQQAHDLAIRIVHESQSWREQLSDLDQGRLRLMMDRSIYLETQNGTGKQLLALDVLIKELSDGQLHLANDPAGIERGGQLKRHIAKQSDQWVPFTDLQEILRQSSPAA